MSVTRDDLQAAARAGRLHYAEIDNLLIFLMQRHEQINKKSTFIPVSASRWYLASFVSVVLATVCAIWIAPGWIVHLSLLALLAFSTLCVLCSATRKPHRQGRGAGLTVFIAVMVVALLPACAVALNPAMIFGITFLKL